jgi:hypothetical protein
MHAFVLRNGRQPLRKNNGTPKILISLSQSAISPEVMLAI